MKKTASAKNKNAYLGFCRVSDKKQVTKGEGTLEVQEASIYSLLHKLDGTFLRVWRIPGESAYKSKKRTHFKEMLAFARNNRDKLKGVIFPRVDRATRNIVDFGALQVLQEETGIRIHFADHPEADICTSKGRLQLGIEAVYAEYRSAHDAENIRDGLKRIREKDGRLPGHAPFGYLNGRDGLKPVILLHDRNAPIVQKIFDLYATGDFTLDSLSIYLVKHGFQYSPSRAAFGRQLLQKILRNRFYIGEIKSDGAWYESKHHTPIVAVSVFMRVQKQLGNRRQESHDHPYGHNLLTCADCNAGVVGELVRKKNPAGEVIRTYLYYRCRDNKHKRKVRATVAELDEQIAKELKKLRLDDGEAADVFRDVMRKGLADAGKSRMQQRQELQKRYEAALATRQNLAGAQPKPPVTMANDDQDALIEDWQASYSQANAACKAIRLELDALEREGDADTDLALKVFELSQGIANKWVAFEFRAKRKLLDILWLNCYWNGATLVPTWNKPFDLLAEGLMVKNGAEERT